MVDQKAEQELREKIARTLWRYKTWVLNEKLEDELSYERFNNNDCADQILTLIKQALPELAKEAGYKLPDIARVQEPNLKSLGFIFDWEVGDYKPS